MNSTSKSPKKFCFGMKIYTFSDKLLLTLFRTKLIQTAHSRHVLCVRAGERAQSVQCPHKQKDLSSDFPAPMWTASYIFITIIFYNKIFTSPIMTHLTNIQAQNTEAYRVHSQSLYILLNIDILLLWEQLHISTKIMFPNDSKRTETHRREPKENLNTH